MGQKGFTLIELSIVLVILGLIVGGIVGGKALIHQAELQRVVQELNGYKTVVGAFYSQYDALPGDFKEAFEYWGQNCSFRSGGGAWGDSQACDGDGNGQINGVPLGYAQTHPWYEDVKAWQHLRLAELIQLNFPTQEFGEDRAYVASRCEANNSGSCPYGSIPESKFGDANGWQLIHTQSVDSGESDGSGVFGYIGNSFTFNGWSNDGSLQVAGSMSARDASSIDKKIDDGKPSSGEMLAAWSNHAKDGDPTDDDCLADSGGSGIRNWSDKDVTYMVSDTTPHCRLWFKLPY